MGPTQTTPALERLLSLGTTRLHPEGDVLVRRGEHPEALHWIVSGRAGVTVEHEGKERTVNALGPGQLVGEISFVTDQAATATVRVEVPSEIVTIPRAAVRALERTEPEAATQLLRFMAALVAERLHRQAQVLAGEGEPPGRDVADWAALLASLRAIRFPPEIEDLLARYAQVVGQRNPFLWRWCWHGLGETTLPLVAASEVDRLRSLKLHAVVLNVVLDDLADHPGQGTSLELAMAAIHGAGVPALVPPSSRDLFELIVDLWQTISIRVRRLPDYARFAPVYAFDYAQVFNTMRYSAIALREPALRNLAENAAYAPHNMNMMVFCTIDAMMGPPPPGDLAAIREAAWHAQAMGQLGNMMTTWRREIPEGDYSSRVVIHALDEGVLDRASLPDRPADEVIAAVEASGVESRLLAEWRSARRRLGTLVERVQSMDMSPYRRGIETLLAMNQAARGLI